MAPATDALDRAAHTIIRIDFSADGPVLHHTAGAEEVPRETPELDDRPRRGRGARQTDPRTDDVIVQPVADDEATGRVHVFNRNGAIWEGRSEIVDVGAVYEDAYRRHDGAWRFARRVEHTQYIVGGAFADLIRASARLPG